MREEVRLRLPRLQLPRPFLEVGEVVATVGERSVERFARAERVGAHRVVDTVVADEAVPLGAVDRPAVVVVVQRDRVPAPKAAARV